MDRILLINANDFKELTPVGGNVDKDKFLEYAYFAQDSDLRNYIGTDLLNALKDKIDTSTLTGNYLTLNSQYIKPYLANAAAERFIRVGSTNMGNAGATTINPENANQASSLGLSSEVRDRANHYGRILIEYLKDNKNLFPEYKTSDTITNSNFIGWQLDYDEGKSC